MRVLLAALLAALSGCSFFGIRENVSDLDADLAKSERAERENQTVSALAALERSVDDYYRHEHQIPEKLDRLVPKYLGEIPAADTAIRGHGSSSRVRYYPANVIRDGVIDGTKLKDTGGWGYAFNGRKVIVFVDCTHPNSRQRPWYREAGAKFPGP
ncbi:MAG: hypothetical protein HY553_00875 [Elusimicrobia bacterium]|nr:hypothetical protein [Elusimicrobiota bacterium]